MVFGAGERTKAHRDAGGKESSGVGHASVTKKLPWPTPSLDHQAGPPGTQEEGEEPEVGEGEGWGTESRVPEGDAGGV